MANSPDPDEPELPGSLRFLRVLVTVLTAVMILGVIAIVTLLVIRLNADPGNSLVLPSAFALPEGVTVTGISQAGTTAVIVTDDNMLRIFDLETQALLQEINLGTLE